MPSYPFVILALLFLAVVTLPPLIAALIDMRRESLDSRGRDRDR